MGRARRACAAGARRASGAAGTSPPATARPDDGAAAVEFAIVSSLVFVLLFWTFQLGWQLFELQSGQSATQQAARYVSAGIPTPVGGTVSPGSVTHDILCLVRPPGGTSATGARLTEVGLHFSLSPDGTGLPTATDGYLTMTLTFRSLVAGLLPGPSLATPDGTFTRVVVTRLDQVPTVSAVLAGFESTIDAGATC